MTVPLTLFSDPICPWCYIGLNRLERSLAGRRNPFRRQWRPFQLNPDMPPEGMDRKAYLDAKFGGPRGASHIYGAIEDAAVSEGLAVAFERIRRTPNTLDAHRLLAWAAAADAAAAQQAQDDPSAADDYAADPTLHSRAQDRTSKALFRFYFEEGADISDREVLAAAAAEAGLDPHFVSAQLETDADREAIRRQDAEARAAGVKAAPTFVIDGRYVAPGAQEPAFWTPVIDEINAKLAARERAAEA